MELTPQDLQTIVVNLARLQTRQEAMECVMRALIAEAPPLHPLLWQALNAAQADLNGRWSRRREEMTPELESDGLALLNELRRACAPPASPGSSTGA